MGKWSIIPFPASLPDFSPNSGLLRLWVQKRNLEVEAGTGRKEWRKEGQGIGRETTRPVPMKQEVEPRGLVTGGGTSPSSLVSFNASTSALLSPSLPVPLCPFLTEGCLGDGMEG